MRCSICNARFPFEKSVPNHICLDGKLNGASCTAAAPGHGQVTEEERAAREALEYIVSRWRRQIGPPDPVWHLMHDVHMMRPEGCVEYVVERCRILAASDAVPGPAVEWMGEPPTEPGLWFWRFVGSTEVHVLELEDDDAGYPFEFEGRPREYWPVRIPTPGEKGTP